MKFRIFKLFALLALLLATNAQAAQLVTFYHHDALGSVIAKSDADGYLYLNEEYQPYGEKIYATEDFFGGSDDWYTGKNYSEELDLTYFGARWYDAKQGRFLSMDPAPVSLLSMHSFNRYHYANNNPFKYIDPDGRDAIIAIDGKDIKITIPIKFSGKGATPEVTNKFTSRIESEWTGTFGKFNVVTSVATEVKDGVISRIEVPEGGGRAFVRGGNRGVWPSERPAWTAAHEAGHLLGLIDRYYDETGPFEGWETNIMGSINKPVEERNIKEAIESDMNKIEEL
ncbi:MAG TPA: RHS repeat-associated core domain-containing protein [Gammaproteobacteria bacterium]|nr:RHS repeat-associated core domain-containing protein [Gammaproteobacteria bacterium]